MNKKSQFNFMPIVYVFFVLLAFYLALYIPIPAFTGLRKTINYFLIIAVWILIQVGFFFFYYQFGKFFIRIFKGYKNLLKNAGNKINKFIVTHV